MTPLEAAKQGYDCFLKGDIPGLVALFSDDSTFTPLMGLEGKMPLVTPKGTFRKHELPGYFAALSEDIDWTAWENRQWVTDRDTVVVLGSYAGRHKRTGKTFACEFAHVLTLAGGKATRFKEFTDTAAILSAATA